MKSHAEALSLLQGPSKKGSRTRARKPPPAPMARANECVVLAVDAGSVRSGVSVWVRDRLAGYDEITRLDLRAMDAAIASAALLATAAELPLVLVIETPPPPHVIYEGRDAYGLVGVNKAIEAWRNAWLRAGYVMRRFIGVQVNRWRASVLGRGWGSQRRDIARDREQAVARVIAESFKHTKPVGPDSAPAVCVGYWATRSGEVAKAIVPTAQRRKRGRA